MEHQHASDEAARSGLDWWLCGNAHTLSECRGSLSVAVTEVVLSVASMVTYVLIAKAFCRMSMFHERGGRHETARTVRMMAGVFLLCAFCGYGFNVLEMFYPAITLKLLAMVFLIVASVITLKRMPDLEHTVDEQLAISKAASDMAGTTNAAAVIRDLEGELQRREEEIAELRDNGGLATARMIQDRIERARESARKARTVNE